MHLTGWPDEEPRAPRRDILAGAAAAATTTPGADAVSELFGRAALAGFRRSGRTSAGGRCRLLRAADGWVAVSLTRPDDLAAVAAIVESDTPIDDPWATLAAFAANRCGQQVVARVRLLDVAASVLGEPVGPAVVVRELGEAAPAVPPAPKVVDLSSLWAGPLCARLLHRNGAQVTAVESVTRPDPTPTSMPQFHTHLRAGHQRLRLDFDSRDGRETLLALVSDADVVIEATRPRALRRLDIDAERLVSGRRGLTWISITAHGRDGPAADRVGFGDDAAVAAGAVAWDARGEPVFCGDAIADPITGLYTARAALRAIGAGGGRVIALSLSGVAADALSKGGPMEPHEIARGPHGRWVVRSAGDEAEVRPPSAPVDR